MTTKIKTYAIPAAAALLLWNAGRHFHAILNYYSTNGTIQLGDGTVIRPKLRVARDIFEWVMMTRDAGTPDVPVVVSEGSYQVIDPVQVKVYAMAAAQAEARHAEG